MNNPDSEHIQINHPKNPLHAEDEETRRSRIYALFRQLDDQEVGYLDATSIARKLDELVLGGSEPRQIPLPPKDSNFPIGSSVMYARELVKVCDQTHDGRITFAEFEAFVKSKEEELWKLFCDVDVGKDNAIHLNDLRTSVRNAGIDVSEKELWQFIEDVDVNGDGIIDFEDWRDFLLLLPHKPTLHNVFSFYNAVNSLELDTNSDIVPKLPDPKSMSRVKYLLAGGIAGSVSRTATAPLDRIRVFLQTQTTARGAMAPSLTLYKDAIVKIYKQGGILSFYRGNGLNVLKIFPESALKFFIFEHTKDFLAQFTHSKDKQDIGVAGRFVSGGIAGLISQFAIYPLDVIKTRSMSQISHDLTDQQHRPPPIFSIIKRMYAQEGVKSFYHGLGASLLGIFPYAGIDLAVFETLRIAYMAYARRKSQNQGEISPERPPMIAVLFMGMISGACGAMTVYPLSVVRTRLQAQGTPSHPETYTSTLDVVKRTFAREGLGGFYKGLGPTMLKLLPAVSISYMVYEKSKKFLSVE